MKLYMHTYVHIYIYQIIEIIFHTWYLFSLKYISVRFAVNKLFETIVFYWLHRGTIASLSNYHCLTSSLFRVFYYDKK